MREGIEERSEAPGRATTRGRAARPKLPRVGEIADMIERHMLAGDWPALAEYLEALWPALLRAAARRRRPDDLRFPLTRAVDQLARWYCCQLAGVGSGVPSSPSKGQQAKRELDQLEDRALCLANLMEWPDMLQELSDTWGEISEALGNRGAAERYHQRAAVYGSQNWLTCGALDKLADLWRTRDPAMEAYFYRWSAQADQLVPASAYVQLYCCLVVAGRQEEVIAEIQQCESSRSKSMADLMQLAAAKQALGLAEEAGALWDESIKLMPGHPRYPGPGFWEAWVSSLD